MLHQNNHEDADYPWTPDKKSGCFVATIAGMVSIPLIFGIAMLSAVMLFMGVYVAIKAPAKLFTDLDILLFNIILPTGGLTLAIVCWLGMRRYAFRPLFKVDRKPAVAPKSLGQPFKAHFSKPFAGSGTVQFDRDRLLLQATSAPNNIFFGAGAGGGALGLLFILLINLVLYLVSLVLHLITRRDFSISILYDDIQSISVTRCTVEIRHSGTEPKRVQLTVASPDGERLYRELYQHYPAAVSDWESQLREIFGERSD